jgi:hypothetical protein
MRSQKGQPPRHGFIRLGGPNAMEMHHAKAHLAKMSAHASGSSLWRAGLSIRRALGRKQKTFRISSFRTRGELSAQSLSVLNPITDDRRQPAITPRSRRE